MSADEPPRRARDLEDLLLGAHALDEHLDPDLALGQAMLALERRERRVDAAHLVRRLGLREDEAVEVLAAAATTTAMSSWRRIEREAARTEEPEARPPVERVEGANDVGPPLGELRVVAAGDAVLEVEHHEVGRALGRRALDVLPHGRRAREVRHLHEELRGEIDLLRARCARRMRLVARQRGLRDGGIGGRELDLLRGVGRRRVRRGHGESSLGSLGEVIRQSRIASSYPWRGALTRHESLPMWRLFIMSSCARGMSA